MRKIDPFWYSLETKMSFMNYSQANNIKNSKNIQRVSHNSTMKPKETPEFETVLLSKLLHL